MTPKKNLTEFLAGYLTPRRQEKIQRVLEQRTRFLTLVLEDIYDPMNASAVIRTAEGMGIQDFHVIENRNKFEIRDKVTTGTSKWINLHRYNQPGTDNTTSCITMLKENGYEIWATSPHEPSVGLSQIQVNRKIALILGSEHLGLSHTALSLSDYRITIPMNGFAESFNISVSAGICIYTILQKIHSAKIDYHLSSTEQAELRHDWIRKTVRRADLLEKKFREESE